MVDTWFVGCVMTDEAKILVCIPLVFFTGCFLWVVGKHWFGVVVEKMKASS